MRLILIVYMMVGISGCELAFADEISAECSNWFKNSRIVKDKGCLSKCVVIPTDMSTFDCANNCDVLCNAPAAPSFLFAVSDLYPGLTPAERGLSAEMPAKTLKAYQLSWRAEKLCLGLFPASLTNDASDGCRHYLWAALLSDELGEKVATRFLNAHEEDPKQPPNEKEMDLKNNELGQKAYSKLKKLNKFSDEELTKNFREDLKSGKVKVLKKEPL